MAARPLAPRRLTPLGALRVLHPEQWAKKVRAAMKASDGRIPEAAESLGVSMRTLFRWLSDDPLLADVVRAPPGPRDR